MRGFRLTVALALAGVLLATMLAIGELRAIGDARASAHTQALQAASERLTRSLVGRDLDGVRAQVRALVFAAPRAALRAQVIDIQGRQLADSQRWSVPSGAIGRALGDWAYDAAGRHGRLRLVDASGAGLGYLEYTRPDALLLPPDQPVLRQRYNRAAGLLALLAAAATGLLVWLIAPPMRPLVLRERAGAAAAATDASQDAGTPVSGRLARWFDLMGYGVIVVDQRQRVRWLNALAIESTGWSPADARGQLVYSVFRIAADDRESGVTPAELALRAGVDVPAEDVVLVSRDGTTRRVEALAGLLRHDEQVVGAVLAFRDTSRQQSALEGVRAEADRAVAILGQLDTGILTTSSEGLIDYANARAHRMFGYGVDEVVGATISKLLPVPFLNSPGVRLEDYVGDTPASERPRVVGWRKDATTFAVELNVHPLERGRRGGYVLAIRDVSREAAESTLSQRLGRLMDSAGEEIYIFDANSLYCLDVNRGAVDNLGRSREELLRMTPMDIAPNMDEQTFHGHLSQLRGGEAGHVCYQTEHAAADGRRYPVEVTLSFSRDQEPPVFLVIAEEISARREAEARLDFIAHHDALTSLPNRLLFMDRLEQAILASRRTGRLLAVGFVDLDLFKRVNDTLGHDVGDELLKAVGQRLMECVRVSDTVARLAGDEYTLLMSGLADREDAERLAHKILEAFNQPITIGDHDIVIGVSIGITLHPLDDAEPRELLRHADEAMYAVKRAGRGNYRIYEPELTPALERRVQIEQALRNAIALDEFTIVVTPVRDLASGALAAANIGVRWSPPGIGEVSTAELADAAQRTGLLQQLELRLLRGACEVYAMLDDSARQADWPLLVALSTWQLRRRDFTLEVRELLERYDMPAHRLVIGLPEGGLLDILEGVKGGFDVLETIGVGFNVINFGSGYQRLGRMSQFPVQFTTVPPAVVSGLADETQTATLSTLLATARSLGARLIAPGADDASAIERLRAVDCELASGDAVDATVSAARFARRAQ